MSSSLLPSAPSQPRRSSSDMARITRARHKCAGSKSMCYSSDRATRQSFIVFWNTLERIKHIKHFGVMARNNYRVVFPGYHLHLSDALSPRFIVPYAPTQGVSFSKFSRSIAKSVSIRKFLSLRFTDRAIIPGVWPGTWYKVKFSNNSTSSPSMTFQLNDGST